MMIAKNTMTSPLQMIKPDNCLTSPLNGRISQKRRISVRRMKIPFLSCPLYACPRPGVRRESTAAARGFLFFASMIKTSLYGIADQVYNAVMKRDPDFHYPRWSIRHQRLVFEAW
jgi:hypothetical protein